LVWPNGTGWTTGGSPGAVDPTVGLTGGVTGAAAGFTAVPSTKCWVSSSAFSFRVLGRSTSAGGFGGTLAATGAGGKGCDAGAAGVGGNGYGNAMGTSLRCELDLTQMKAQTRTTRRMPRMIAVQVRAEELLFRDPDLETRGRLGAFPFGEGDPLLRGAAFR